MIDRYRRWKRNSKFRTFERFRVYLDLVIEKGKRYEMGQLSECDFRLIMTEYREVSDWLDSAEIRYDSRACYGRVNELIDNSILVKQDKPKEAA